MKSTIFFSVLCLFFILSCSKNNKKYPIVRLVPYDLFFSIKQNGNKLSDLMLDSCKMYYKVGINKIYLEKFGRCINDGSFAARDFGLLVAFSGELGIKSSKDNIKQYYIEYPNGTQDTLFANYEYINESAAENDPCLCEYPIRSVKFNGVEAGLDSSLLQYQTVYLFNKK